MNKRTEQVESEIQNNVSEIINRYIELSNYLITITKVTASPDLKIAYLSISVLPENKTGTALKKLEQNKSLIRKLLKPKIRFYTNPQLKFFVDEGDKKRREINEKLKEIRQEDAQRQDSKNI
ncbi:30S ribosome-binding factor RbfA [bacterium]|nr:30S ribosome-binding factor RbfA [bacterium]